MLCSESAVGVYCDKAVDVLTSISTQIEEWCRSVLRLFVCSFTSRVPSLQKGEVWDHSVARHRSNRRTTRRRGALRRSCDDGQSTAHNGDLCLYETRLHGQYSVATASRLSDLCIHRFLLALLCDTLANLFSTDSAETRRRLNLRWGVCPFLMEFEASPEKNVQRTFT